MLSSRKFLAAPGTLKVEKAQQPACFSGALGRLRSQNSLGVCGDLTQLVKLPAGEQLLDWLLLHCTDFYYELRTLYANLEGHCTEQSCPTMSAGADLILSAALARTFLLAPPSLASLCCGATRTRGSRRPKVRVQVG